MSRSLMRRTVLHVDSCWLKPNSLSFHVWRLALGRFGSWGGDERFGFCFGDPPEIGLAWQAAREVTLTTMFWKCWRNRFAEGVLQGKRRCAQYSCTLRIVLFLILDTARSVWNLVFPGGKSPSNARASDGRRTYDIWAFQDGAIWLSLRRIHPSRRWRQLLFFLLEGFDRQGWKGIGMEFDFVDLCQDWIWSSPC